MTRTRLLAAAAGAAVLVGAVVMLVALVAAPGSWWWGYVSEAGTAGQPFAVAYRWGLLLLALGVGLLGVAFARQLPNSGGRFRLVRRPGAVISRLLGAAAVMAGTSGAVSCSNQCPLPPFEPTTVADVVHTAAGIVGMVMLALAMLAVTLLDPLPAARRLAAIGAVLTVPLGISLGLVMFLVGRGALGATLERLLLAVVVSWLIGTSLLTVLRNSVKVEPWNRSRTGSPPWSSDSPT
jgi:hypothetical protein